jgi:predicted RNA-binding Zn-ribbon protein involved in translation (DUF1610 family)
MNKELVASELLKIAEMLVGTTGTFKCPECGTGVLENTGYCVKCKKKVKEATTGTFKCPECGTGVLENTGYCVKCKKKVKQSAIPGMTMGDVLDFKNRGTQPAGIDLSRLSRMALNEIADVVYSDWKNVNYAAKPYLEAMATLRDIKDNYILDTGSSIVAYFLSNATSWRGEVAKIVKKELNRRLKAAY